MFPLCEYRRVSLSGSTEAQWESSRHHRFKTYLRSVVSLSKTLYSLKVHVLVITNKYQLHRHNFGHGRITIHPDLFNRNASA